MTFVSSAGASPLLNSGICTFFIPSARAHSGNLSASAMAQRICATRGSMPLHFMTPRRRGVPSVWTACPVIIDSVFAHTHAVKMTVGGQRQLSFFANSTPLSSLLLPTNRKSVTNALKFHCLAADSALSGVDVVTLSKCSRSCSAKNSAVSGMSSTIKILQGCLFSAGSDETETITIFIVICFILSLYCLCQILSLYYFLLGEFHRGASLIEHL